MNACIESCEHILFPLNLYQWSCGYSSFSFSMYILLHFQLPFYFLWWKNSVALRKFCVLRWPFFFAISRFSKLIVPTKLQFFIFRIKRFLFLFFFLLTWKKMTEFLKVQTLMKDLNVRSISILSFLLTASVMRSQGGLLLPL